MKYQKKQSYLFAAILILAAFWMLYTFPFPPEQLVRDLDLSSCERLTLEATEYPDDPRHEISYSLVLTPGDEGFDEIISALRGMKFHRSLLSFLSKNATQSHPISAGDACWSVHCLCGDTVFRLENFFGEASMRSDPGDKYAKLRPAGSADWQNSILTLIKENPKTQLTK